LAATIGWCDNDPHFFALLLQAFDQASRRQRQRLPAQQAFSSFCGVQVIDALLQFFHFGFQARSRASSLALAASSNCTSSCFCCSRRAAICQAALQTSTAAASSIPVLGQGCLLAALRAV
jgi:hypothetical protein